jgi:hypothetical protein
LALSKVLATAEVLETGAVLLCWLEQPNEEHKKLRARTEVLQ